MAAMTEIEKGQHVRFIHPRTGDDCVGKILRVDRNNRPAGCNITMIETEQDVVSVPNGLIRRSFPSAHGPDQQ